MHLIDFSAVVKDALNLLNCVYHVTGRPVLSNTEISNVLKTNVHIKDVFDYLKNSWEC